jgi:hypothetical protein
MKKPILLMGILFFSHAAWGQSICDDPIAALKQNVDCSAVNSLGNVPTELVKAQVAQEDNVNACGGYLGLNLLNVSWNPKESASDPAAKRGVAQGFLCKCKRAVEKQGNKGTLAKNLAALEKMYKSMGVGLANCSADSKVNKNNLLAMGGCAGFMISVEGKGQMIIPLEDDTHGVGPVRRAIDVLKGCGGCTVSFTKQCGGM